MNLRRLALWLHGWVGITVGAWLAVVGLTGSLLLWRPEVEPHLNARMRVSSTVPGTISLQSAYDIIHKRYPKKKIDRIYLARGNGLAHEFRLRGKSADDDQSVSVFVDPHTGNITGEQAYDQDFYGRVDELHVRLLSGDLGHTFVGVGGSVLLLMALSGIWLWWPRRNQWKRAFVPQLKTNWRGRTYELHRVAGILLCGLFISEAVTGMTLVWSAPAQQLLGKIFPGGAEKKVPKASKGALLPLDNYVNQALGLFPGAQISRFTFPKKAGTPLVVRLQQKGELNPAGNTSVSFDPVSGRILQVDNSGGAARSTQLMNLRYPIHTGRWGGVLSRILYTFMGLSLPSFYVSGLVLWWSKRRKKRRSQSPQLALETSAAS